jgi:hypothetical protein
MARKSTKHLAAIPAFRSTRLEFDAGADSIGIAVDRLGRVKAAIAGLEVYEKALKEAVIAHGEAAVEGTTFRATVSIAEQLRLDTKAIRVEMGDDWCGRFEKPSIITTVRVAARTGVDLAAAE